MAVRQTINYHNVARVSVGQASVLYTSESAPRRLVVRDIDIEDADGNQARITLIGEGHDIPVKLKGDDANIAGNVTFERPLEAAS